MFSTAKTLMVVIDVQGKLAQLMHNREALFRNLQIIVKGIRILNIPILWVEQNPVGLGSTIPEIASLMPDLKPIPKMCFSTCRNTEFMEALRASGRKQILLVGIEAHICVYQTAIELLNLGYDVEVVSDGVSSRTMENRDLALAKMRKAGIGLTSVEMILFELLGVAEGGRFKEIAKIVK